jgi:uncharacterized protein YuzE
VEKRLRIYYFKETDSLDIWFDEPEKEELSEETDDIVLLKKDKEGTVIGLELISIASLRNKPVEIPVSDIAISKSPLTVEFGGISAELI